MVKNIMRCKNYAMLLLIIFLLIFCYFVATIALGKIVFGLSFKNKLVFVLHLVSVIIFYFLYKKWCQSKAAFKMHATNCSNEAASASIIYIFFSGIFVLYMVSNHYI